MFSQCLFCEESFFAHEYESADKALPREMITTNILALYKQLQKSAHAAKDRRYDWSL